MNGEVLGIFPTLIAMMEIGEGPATTASLKELEMRKTHKEPTDGRLRSVDGFVLERAEFADLKKKILQAANTYANDVLGLVGEYGVTQSWTNTLKNDVSFPRHIHSNSIISGVYYFGGGDHDIIFSKSESNNTWTMVPAEDLDPKHPSAHIAHFNVKSGYLILFPSYLFHQVPRQQRVEDRHSLAINFMPMTAVGNDTMLNCLPYAKML